jgi:tetratricopeptide (TPR) repeat protein
MSLGLFFLALAATCGVAQAPKSPDYSGESLVVENLATVFRYNADGTGEKSSSMRLRVQTEAGARQFSVLSIPFAASTQQPAVVKLVAHHTDGTSTDTPPSDAMEMPAPVTQQAPLYSDLKMLQIPVRGLRAGDTLEYDIRVNFKNPEAPTQFWDKYEFTTKLVVLSETLTLDVPSEKNVQQWSASLKPTVSESGGRKVYVWHTSQLKPTPGGNKKDEDESAGKKTATPDVAWSTFRTWAEVGEWYRALAAPRAVPTDALRAQADEITRDAKSPLEQVQALYAFVSTRIRYVGIDFGMGRYQPHTAAEVLLSRYGDCKDKDTLFEALLRAKGFSASPALIGVNLDLVPELPSPGFFNHVITTINLPTGRVWADVTPGVAPFQMLLSAVRDKQALVIPQEGAPALDRTPANPPFPLNDRFEAESTLSKDGELTGKVNVSFRSDTEILVRAVALNLAPAQWDQGAQLVANALGFSGTVSNAQFDHPEDVATPVRITYNYEKKPYGIWDDFRILPLIPVNDLPEAPEKQPTKDIDLGAPRTETALSRIHLPAGFGADLPDAVHVKTDFASVDQTFKLENGDLIVQRQIVVTRGKLPPKNWEDYKKFAKDVSLSNSLPWIQLTLTAPAQGSGAHPPKPGENNPAAADLINEVVDLEKKQDWHAAEEKLDEAKKINPEQPFLWSNYGYLQMVQNHPDEASDHFKHELSLHPDETYVVALYAGLLLRRSKVAEARKVLQASFDRDPSQINVVMMLASLQANDRLDEAIATVRKAIESKPKESQLLDYLGSLLVRKGDDAGARDVAAKLYDMAGDDPDLLNNVAYLSAEAGGDLAQAEKASRRSLDALDTQTSSAGVSEANQQSFARSALIVASWDTLGYVLLKEKKLDEALDYLEAAWRNTPTSAAVAYHYGLALEATGKKAEALSVYVASTSEVHILKVSPGIPNPDTNAMEDRIAKLKSAGVTPPPERNASGILQDERTFKVQLPTACRSFVNSTFRVQLSSGSNPEFLHVSGEPLSESSLKSLKSLRLPHLVPADSKARILRDAVVTCSAKQSSAYVVFMPMGGISAEKAGE